MPPTGPAGPTPARPAACGNPACKSTLIEPHCAQVPSASCNWVRCKSCTTGGQATITGLILGRPHVSGTPPEWAGSGPAQAPGDAA